MNAVTAHFQKPLAPPYGVLIDLVNNTDRAIEVQLPMVVDGSLCLLDEAGRMVDVAKFPCFGQPLEKVTVASHAARALAIDLSPYFFGLDARFTLRLRFAWAHSADAGVAVVECHTRLCIPGADALVRNHAARLASTSERPDVREPPPSTSEGPDVGEPPRSGATPPPAEPG